MSEPSAELRESSNKLLTKLVRSQCSTREEEVAIVAEWAQAEIDRARTDYNEPLILAKQRVAIVERIMKLPYIKATQDTEKGEERFVCRDEVITAVHDYARALAQEKP